MDEKDQQALTAGVIQEYGLDLARLWLEYVALGGNATEDELRDYSAGLLRLPLKERDVLSQAVNEHSGPAGAQDRLAVAPYSDSPLTVSRTDPTGSCSSA
jgi:hypothetical protein